MRYLPLTDADRRDMLNLIGVDNVDALFADVQAEDLNVEFDLPDHAGELDVERAIAALAAPE